MQFASFPLQIEKIGSNSSVDGSVKQQERPEVDFERKIISLQVVNGSQASLMCSVTHLGQHQVRKRVSKRHDDH